MQIFKIVMTVFSSIWKTSDESGKFRDTFKTQKNGVLFF